jgi:predicted DNA binding protein
MMKGRVRVMGLCNRCTYNNMVRRAKERGATVYNPVPGTGEWEGWTLVYSSEKGDQPIALFMELTDECAC